MNSNIASRFEYLFKDNALSQGVFITGTDTDVGKTWVGCQIIEYLTSTGVDVAPRKPVESGWPEKVTQTDAWKLAKAANKTEQLDIVCQNRFKAAISPARAAALEGQLLTVSQLQQQCLSTVAPEQLLYVEGAGGFYSPLCEDGLNADLCDALKLPIILVAEDKLGCINHVLLNKAVIEMRGLKLIAVILNQITRPESHSRLNNYADLQSMLDCKLIKTSDE